MGGPAFALLPYTARALIALRFVVPLDSTHLAEMYITPGLVMPFLFATMANTVCKFASWVTGLMTANLATASYARTQLLQAIFDALKVRRGTVACRRFLGSVLLREFCLVDSFEFASNITEKSCIGHIFITVSN